MANKSSSITKFIGTLIPSLVEGKRKSYYESPQLPIQEPDKQNHITQTVDAPQCNMCDIINKDTVINGSITTTSDIIINGEVTGDISAAHIEINGMIRGNIAGVSAALGNSEVLGNITCAESVIQDTQSIVTGDIKAMGADIGGKIDGNLLINGNLILRTTAIVNGSIEAKTMSMEEKAVIDGTIKIMKQ